LAALAVAVVADDWPGFFQPSLLERASQLACRVEAVDSCGLLPIRVAGRAFGSAYSFRRFLQAELSPHLGALPDPDPLRRLPARLRAEVPAGVLNRWQPATLAFLAEGLPSVAFAHDIPPARLAGGQDEGQERLRRFLEGRLSRYYDDRNAPDADAASGLSPYLHFGHISPFQILARLAEHEDWAPDRLANQGRGQREGWWGMSRSAEAFLDELVTWRELGLNAAAFLPDYESYRSLPEWSRRTLAEHAADPRPYVYDLDTLGGSRTHDALWNAAQRQLREEGVIQNYMRMVWGKKILEWSPSPEAAAEAMIELNNRYALDGRDPNSYSGVFWCLGRYDRPWGPERPIFGKVRYMSSANTARKLPVAEYLARYK
jgi:deoxyribodipyrimidine photo-lyase